MKLLQFPLRYWRTLKITQKHYGTICSLNTKDFYPGVIMASVCCKTMTLQFFGKGITVEGDASHFRDTFSGPKSQLNDMRSSTVRPWISKLYSYCTTKEGVLELLSIAKCSQSTWLVLKCNSHNYLSVKLLFQMGIKGIQENLIWNLRMKESLTFSVINKCLLA